jgi:hypothetical protein
MWEVRGRPEPPAVRLDDRPADRQPHPHTGGLGGEEGAEQPIDVVGGDSHAGVVHGHGDVIDVVPLRPDRQLPWPLELFPGLLERMLGTASRRAHRGHEEAQQREDRQARRLGEIDVRRIERRRKEVT